MLSYLLKIFTANSTTRNQRYGNIRQLNGCSKFNTHNTANAYKQFETHGTILKQKKTYSIFSYFFGKKSKPAPEAVECEAIKDPKTGNYTYLVQPAGEALRKQTEEEARLNALAKEKARQRETEKREARAAEAAAREQRKKEDKITDLKKYVELTEKEIIEAQPTVQRDSCKKYLEVAGSKIVVYGYDKLPLKHDKVVLPEDAGEKTIFEPPYRMLDPIHGEPKNKCSKPLDVITKSTDECQVPKIDECVIEHPCLSQQICPINDESKAKKPCPCACKPCQCNPCPYPDAPCPVCATNQIDQYSSAETDCIPCPCHKYKQKDAEFETNKCRTPQCLCDADAAQNKYASKDDKIPCRFEKYKQISSTISDVPTMKNERCSITCKKSKRTTDEEINFSNRCANFEDPCKNSKFPIKTDNGQDTSLTSDSSFCQENEEPIKQKANSNLKRTTSDGNKITNRCLNKNALTLISEEYTQETESSDHRMLDPCQKKQISSPDAEVGHNFKPVITVVPIGQTNSIKNDSYSSSDRCFHHKEESEVHVQKSSKVRIDLDIKRSKSNKMIDPCSNKNALTLISKEYGEEMEIFDHKLLDPCQETKKSGQNVPTNVTYPILSACEIKKKTDEFYETQKLNYGPGVDTSQSTAPCSKIDMFSKPNLSSNGNDNSTTCPKLKRWDSILCEKLTERCEKLRILACKYKNGSQDMEMPPVILISKKVTNPKRKNANECLKEKQKEC